jgi:type IV secretory pathway VirB4 component
MLSYQGMSVFAFDKGLSLYPLCKAAGGVHYSVAADDESLAFCPLQYTATKTDRSWAMEWIDTMLALNGLKTTPGQRNEIAKAIVSMHQTGSVTLTDFTGSIQDQAIREALTQYTVDGMMGHLLDATRDGLSISHFMVFEIEDLMGLGEKFALPTLLYLFRRIEKSLHGQPAAIVIDEAWLSSWRPKACRMRPIPAFWMSSSNPPPPRYFCPIWRRVTKTPPPCTTAWD